MKFSNLPHTSKVGYSLIERRRPFPSVMQIKSILRSVLKGVVWTPSVVYIRIGVQSANDSGEKGRVRGDFFIDEIFYGG